MQALENGQLQEDFENQFGTEMDQLERGINGLQKQLEQTNVDLLKIQSEVDKILKEQSALAQEKDLLLMRKHTAEQLKNPAQRTKFFDKEISQCQLQSAQSEKDKTDATKHINLLKKSITEAQEGLSSKSQELESVKVKIASAQQEMESARTAKKLIATRVKEKIFETNEAELTISATKKKLVQNQQQLDKVDASYVTLRRIDAACKEQQIAGYKGLLIDQLELVDSRFNAAVDIAGKAKLFSIIVEDLTTA